MLIFTPTTFNPAYDPTLGRYPYSPILGTNPLDVIANWKARDNVNRFIGGFTTNWNPIPSLTVNYLFGLDRDNESFYYYQPPLSTGAAFTGSVQNPTRDITRFNNDLTVTHEYDLTSGLHATTTLGGRQTSDHSDEVRAAALGLSPGQTTVGAGGATPSSSQGIIDVRTLGGFVQERLGFGERLFITGGLNYEASSAFGADQRWQAFPRLGASWSVDQEPFWENSFLSRALSTLRLRAAYGETGGQPPSAYSIFDNYAVASRGGAAERVRHGGRGSAANIGDAGGGETQVKTELAIRSHDRQGSPNRVRCVNVFSVSLGCERWRASAVVCVTGQNGSVLLAYTSPIALPIYGSSDAARAWRGEPAMPRAASHLTSLETTMHRGHSIRLGIISVGLFTIVGCNADRASEPVSVASPFGVPPRSSRTVVPLDPDSPFGIDFNGNHIYDNATTKAQAAQLMAQAGVRFARIGAYWAYMEQGQSNGLHSGEKAKLDTTVNALIAAGIEPYVTLEGTACYAISISTWPCTWDEQHHTPDTEAHWQAWATYVQEMVQAYPQVHYWGIWNEPNSDFLIPWTGDRLTAYKQLVEAASPIIRAAGGKVIAPDLGGGVDSLNISPTDAPTWLANFMADDSSLVDIVAVHYYSGSTSQSYVQTMWTFADAAGDKDVWLTEVAPGNWESGVTDADQARNLAAVYRAMLSWQVPKWKKTFYFTAGQFDAPANSGIVHDLGLTSQTPRPAYDTLKSIAAVLPIALNGPEFLYGQPQTYTWDASAAGGTAPYTYFWDVDDTEPYGDIWQSIPAAEGANSLSLFVDGCDGQFALRVRAHDSDPWEQRWGSSWIVVENFLQEGSPGCVGNQKPW